MTSGDEGKLFAGLPEHPAPERTYQDKPRLRMAERRQVELRAICLDDLVPTDHRVRMVWNFVEGLDVSALVAAVKAVEGRPGHPPADPRILLALWLYATADGVGSARELARLCDEHIAYQWLCGGVGMNAKREHQKLWGIGRSLRRWRWIGQRLFVTHRIRNLPLQENRSGTYPTVFDALPSKPWRCTAGWSGSSGGSGMATPTWP
jgi:hypothetical protein